jgi:phage terminase large subunit-like protein
MLISADETPPAVPDPHAFPRAVVAGTQPANVMIQAACRRHLADLERADVYWCDDEWSAYVDLVSKLRIVDGHQLTGQPLTILPWQAWVVGSILAWKYHETGGRRFKAAWIECARGAGKTSLAATLLLHCGFQYPGADVLCLANTVVQARQAFDQANAMGAAAFGNVHDPESEGVGDLRITERKTVVLPTGARIRPYASKTSTLDGLKAIAYVLDETSEAKSDGMFAKIESATQKLRDSFFLSITTPGGIDQGRDSVYYNRRRTAVEALDESTAADLDGTFSALFGIDDADDLADPAVWIKGQPSLGHVIPVQQYHRMLESYRVQGKLGDFERFGCCRYTTKGMRWVPGDTWDANVDENTPEYPTDPDTPIYAAVDLSKSFDISSLAWAWHENGRVCVRWHHWIIERNAGDHMLDYQRRIDTWRELPNVTVCDHQIQYESIKARLWDLKRRGNLIRVGFDRIGGMKTEVQRWGDRDERYNAETDLPMTAVPQGMATMGPACHLAEAWLRDRRFRLQLDPVVEYALAGVNLVSDTNGNRKPCKSRSRCVIDPVVAFVMGMAIIILEGAQAPGAYHDPGEIAI